MVGWGAGDWKGRGALTWGESRPRSHPNPNANPTPDPNSKVSREATVIAYLLLEAQGQEMGGGGVKRKAGHFLGVMVGLDQTRTLT